MPQLPFRPSARRITARRAARIAQVSRLSSGRMKGPELSTTSWESTRPGTVCLYHHCTTQQHPQAFQVVRDAYLDRLDAFFTATLAPETLTATPLAQPR